MNPTIAITPERAALRLSDSVVVTVTVEGDLPLRVDAPRDPLLAGESAGLWQAMEVGAPRTEAVAGGRERWTQVYRCSPYTLPGEGVPLEFSPFLVRSGGATEPVPLPDGKEARPLYFRVASDLVGARAEDARPVTGVEELPPDPPPLSGPPAVWAVAVPAVVIALAAAFATARRRKAERRVPPAAEAFDALDALGTPPPLAQVAGIVRRFLGRRLGVPTEPATTAELIALVRSRNDWTAEHVTELDAILTTCDRAKFADRPPDADVAIATRERARAWVAAVSTGVATS